MASRSKLTMKAWCSNCTARRTFILNKEAMKGTHRKGYCKACGNALYIAQPKVIKHYAALRADII